MLVVVRFYVEHVVLVVGLFSLLFGMCWLWLGCVLVVLWLCVGCG